MEAQIFGLEDQPKPVIKICGKIDSYLLPAVEARGEEIEEKALRLQKEKKIKETSLKIFDWVKKTPDSQIGIIVSWADYNLPSGAMRLAIFKGKKSKKLLIKVFGIIGKANYKINQTWHIRSVPKELKDKVKRAIEEKLDHIKNENARLVLFEMRLAQ